MSLMPLQPDVVTVSVYAAPDVVDFIDGWQNFRRWRSPLIEYAGSYYVETFPQGPSPILPPYMALRGFGGEAFEEPTEVLLRPGRYPIERFLDGNFEEDFTVIDFVGHYSGSTFLVEVERVQYIASATSFIQAVILIAPFGAFTAFLWRSLFSPLFYFGQIALLSRRRRLEE